MQRIRVIHLIVLSSSPLVHILGRDPSQALLGSHSKQFLCVRCTSLIGSGITFLHPSAVENCLSHLRSCIPPCPPVPVLLQTRRAAPVFRGIGLASAVVLHVQRLLSRRAWESFSVCWTGGATPGQWASRECPYGFGRNFGSVLGDRWCDTILLTRLTHHFLRPPLGFRHES